MCRTEGNTLKKQLFIAFVIAYVIGSCIVEGKTLGKTGVPMTLNDVLDGKYIARRNNATWISDTLLYYRDSSRNIVTLDIKTNQTKILADARIPAVASSFSQELSPDRQFMLLAKDQQQVFRHSFLARYEVLNLKTNKLVKLSEDLLSLAKWGPLDNSVLYIKDNNIYYKSSVATPAVQITHNGNATTYNGICDWVYEEEVFSTKSAAWISPDNKKLAYIEFNDAQVNHIAIPIYGKPGDVNNNQYPGVLDFAYPKVGTNNPLVKLFLVDLTSVRQGRTVKKTQVPAPKEFSQKQHIISVVAWANNEILVTTWMNRVQNHAIVEACQGNACHQVLDISSSTGWVEFFKPPTFNKDGSQFAYILPQFQKDANDSYKHLTLVSVETGKQTVLTSGKYVVLDILQWNENTNTIVYTANEENASYNSHVWSVQVSNSSVKQCLTCSIAQDGVPQTYFSGLVSPNGKRILINNEGASIPRTDIFNIVESPSQNSYELQLIRTWESNDKLRTLMNKVKQSDVEYHHIPLKHGFDAVVKLTLPPYMDKSGETKYPMIVDVYAGPSSFASFAESDVDFKSYNSYLASSPQYILAQINGRGSGNRGEKLLHSIYRALGTVEIEDQIETTKKLTELFSFIDASNVAIWGWSYGGYAAGMALAQDDSHVFKCAASVAPVTDWLYYDTIYTERYMGLPTKEDNAQGYERSRLSTKAYGFKNRTYLLVHGTFDDNVHYQQSMALARTLELNDIPFEQITYPDEDHSLINVRRHFYHALNKFFAKCLTSN